jgi:hypothetical protein
MTDDMTDSRAWEEIEARNADYRRRLRRRNPARHRPIRRRRLFGIEVLEVCPFQQNNMGVSIVIHTGRTTSRKPALRCRLGGFKDYANLFRQEPYKPLPTERDRLLAKLRDRHRRFMEKVERGTIGLVQRYHDDEFRDLDVEAEPIQSNAPPACTVPVSVPAGIGRAR